MANLDWERIDDHDFVHLCADLLRSLGFIDILIFGDGPDGGLDLVASELVGFAIQGQRPFRWGIQCKFSVDGKRRAVADRDVTDVEGILRSDRYLPHAVRGYLLMTNRRVAQNVVERLQGIDRQSQFRATYLSGAHFEQMLAERPHLIDKYFVALPELRHRVGRPTLLSRLDQTTYRGHFVLPIEVRNALHPEKVIKLNGILDSGSDISSIPREVLKRLDLNPSDFVQFMDFTGTTIKKELYLVGLRIGDGKFVTSQAIVTDESYVSIGNDILSNMTYLVDGPNRVVRVW